MVVVNIDNKLDDATLPRRASRCRSSARTTARARGWWARSWRSAFGTATRSRSLRAIPTAFNAQQRRQGFEDAMRTAGMRVVAVQSGQWEQAKANAVVSAMLREHPDLKAILASNDNMALGAVAAVRQAGGRARSPWSASTTSPPSARCCATAACSRRRTSTQRSSRCSASSTRSRSCAGRRSRRIAARRWTWSPAEKL